MRQALERIDSMHLIVKGSAEEATKAAEERGIEFIPLHEFKTWNETAGVAPQCRLAAVQQWIAEHPQAPYPPGALLLFTEKL
jgi:hypothetical protein